MSKIVLITGEQGIGKTTALMQEFANEKIAGGVLMPVINGIRNFYSLKTKEYWIGEASASDIEILDVGRFKFSTVAFEKANDIILQDISKFSTIILDEIGPLEMNQHRGLYGSLLFCLEHIEKIEKLILVVRPALLEDLKRLCLEFCDDVSVTEVY